MAPLSLEKFWDAFLSDDAPYYIESIMLDPEDMLLLSTEWRKPSDDYENLLDTPVLKERIFEKSMRLH